MILVDRQIKNYIKGGYIEVTPYDESLVKTSSLDVRAGRFFTKHSMAEGWEYIDPRNPESFNNTTVEADSYIMPPWSTIKVSLLEDITLPDFISVKLFGKSSAARLCIENSPSAMFAEAGWSGVLTCELYNFDNYRKLIRAGDPIGQLVFFEHDNAEKPYNGQYLRQQAGSGSKGVK